MVGVGFFGRRLERSKMGSIDFVALHEADMAEAGSGRFDGIDRVDQHRHIGLHQLRPCRPVLIGGMKDMRHLAQAAELLP